MKKIEIVNLLNEMTIEEKIGQLIQLDETFYINEYKNVVTGPLKNMGIEEHMLYKVGSILNATGAEKTRKIQNDFLSKSRLKIPPLFMADIINGYKTIFPIPLAQGCSWDTKSIKECAEISMKEATVSGITVNFSPMLDLVRDARWGRVMESIGGEDPFLTEIYAKALIEGYQGKNISKKHKGIACIKHFASYGAVQAGRDYNSVDMSERELREYYLSGYKAAIKAGAKMVMTAFNIMNGIPCSANKWLMKDILRKELRFSGVVISDYGAIGELITHGVAKDKKEASYKAMDSNIDIDMMSSSYANHMKELIEENKIAKNMLDDAVLRILMLKNKLGLFENPYKDANIEKEKKILLCDKHKKKAREVATETFVLLKNNKNALPINPNNKIALIGPYADNMGIMGSWSMFCDRTNIKTLKQALQERMKNNNLFYAKGSEILRQEEINSILTSDVYDTLHIENEEEMEQKYIEEAVKVAKKSDVIVLAVGEHYMQSGEGCSRANIDVPKNQQRLILELANLKIHIVVILFNGRPLAIKDIEDKVDAILEVWFPGTEGANAVADVIFGDKNPSGKLNMSFPQSVGQCPVYYNHYNTGRPDISHHRYESKYQDIPTEPFYPFGYGLSYSKFKYKSLSLSSKIMNKDTDIIVNTVIKNDSMMGGYEVVQLYIQDLVGSVVRPVKELKAFQKVYFESNEEKEILFTITKDMLKFWNKDIKHVLEPGEFKVYVGGSSEENLMENFIYDDGL